MDNLDVFSTEIDTRSFSAGEIIFQRGDAGDVMYLVKKGEVDITLGHELLETVRAGDILGEMALISNEPRSATAIARSDCTLASIDQSRFMFLIQKTPYFSLQVMRILAKRLQNKRPC